MKNIFNLDQGIQPAGTVVSHGVVLYLSVFDSSNDSTGYTTRFERAR